MKRQKLRRYAFSILFGMSVSNDLPEEALCNYLESFRTDYTGENGEFNKTDLDFIRKTVYGVHDNYEEIDTVISKYSKGYSIGRISRTALVSMRVAIYEIIYCPDIPDSVSVNEAVEIIKEFEDEKSGKFVNGILGSFLAERKL